MENIYIPPTTKTTYPDQGHRRLTPNYSQITDEHRRAFFTNINEPLLKSVRRIKNS